LCVEKDIVRYKKRILDLNKDKDNYGKNSRGRYPENKRGVIAPTTSWKGRAIEVLEKAQVSQDKKVQDWNDDEIGAIRSGVCFQN
jgi:small subunit ribosomal protein S13